jgi:hypothetical protein
MPCLTLLQCYDHALSEHKTLKDILSDIDAMTVTSPGFNDKLQILMQVGGSLAPMWAAGLLLLF